MNKIIIYKTESEDQSINFEAKMEELGLSPKIILQFRVVGIKSDQENEAIMKSLMGFEAEFVILNLSDKPTPVGIGESYGLAKEFLKN